MIFGIIGYGSIGQRHVRNLIALGYKDIVLLRKIGSGNNYDLKEFTEIQEFFGSEPDAVIITNPTNLHAEFLTQILSLDINVLVEKPLVATIEEWQSLQDQLLNYNGIGMTAYNMRFHPSVSETQKIITENKLGKIYSARFFVGQYLPDWRHGTDYTKSYSASSEMGGGVLFDLIHEIDLAYFLIGEPLGRVAYQVDRLSDLRIDSEDLAELLYRTEDKSFVSIHLDYLTRNYQRYIEIVGERGNLRADLFSNKVTVMYESGEPKKKYFPKFSRNDMYINMLVSFINCLDEKNTPPVSLQKGLISNRIAIDIRNEFYGNA